MKSKKGGRIIINLSTPEIHNLPESMNDSAAAASTDSIIDNLLGSIVNKTEETYTIHLVLFNCFKQRDWGYLKFYLEKHDDMYFLPSIKTTLTIDNNVDDTIKKLIIDRHKQINSHQIKDIFQDKDNLYAFIDDNRENSMASENQRWFISSEMNESYVHETCRNMMNYESIIYNALSDATTRIYSSSYAYICTLENQQYINVEKSDANRNEDHPITEHNVIGRTHIFSTTLLTGINNNARKYVYPANKENIHVVDIISQDTYATLKDTSVITFNENGNKLVSIKPRNLFIET